MVVDISYEAPEPEVKKKDKKEPKADKHFFHVRVPDITDLPLVQKFLNANIHKHLCKHTEETSPFKHAFKQIRKLKFEHAEAEKEKAKTEREVKQKLVLEMEKDGMDKGQKYKSLKESLSKPADAEAPSNDNITFPCLSESHFTKASDAASIATELSNLVT